MTPHNFTVLLVSANERLQGVTPVLLGREAALVYFGGVRNAGEALIQSQKSAPDVIVSDAPPSNGIEILTWREVRENGPRLVMLTRYVQEGDDVRAALAGAAGLILVPERRLAESILRAARGDLLRSEQLAGRLRAIASGEAPNALNGPERRVLGLVTDGKADGAIARQLGLPEADVREHIVRIAGKLG